MRVHAMRRASEANPVSLDEIRHLAEQRFGDLVKAVVDLKRGIMLLDAELHADQEAELLADGSVHFLSETTNQSGVIHPLVTRNDGKVFTLP